jgi:hypothetical protein
MSNLQYFWSRMFSSKRTIPGKRQSECAGREANNRLPVPVMPNQSLRRIYLQNEGVLWYILRHSMKWLDLTASSIYLYRIIVVVCISSHPNVEPERLRVFIWFENDSMPVYHTVNHIMDILSIFLNRYIKLWSIQDHFLRSSCHACASEGSSIKALDLVYLLIQIRNKSICNCRSRCQWEELLLGCLHKR